MARCSKSEEDGLPVSRGEAAVHGLVPRTVLSCHGAKYQMAASCHHFSGLRPPGFSVLSEYDHIAGESTASGTLAGESWDSSIKDTRRKSSLPVHLRAQVCLEELKAGKVRTLETRSHQPTFGGCTECHKGHSQNQILFMHTELCCRSLEKNSSFEDSIFYPLREFSRQPHSSLFTAAHFRHATSSGAQSRRQQYDKCLYKSIWG